MRINLTAKLAQQMGVKPGADGFKFAADGSCTFDAWERTTRAPAPRQQTYAPPAPAAPQGPSKLALGLAARFVATGAAADVAEGLQLAAARFEQY